MQWATLFRAFLVEAQWFGSGKLPMAKEYLENGIISSGVHIVLVHIFFLLGHGLTNQNVELIDNNPDIISSTATILRLWDDLGSAKVTNSSDFKYFACNYNWLNKCRLWLNRITLINCRMRINMDTMGPMLIATWKNTKALQLKVLGNMLSKWFRTLGRASTTNASREIRFLCLSPRLL